MGIADNTQSPETLTYYTLRKAVGIVAFGLPFALALPWWVLGCHSFEKSISRYYYTPMRDLFVGSLCAIAMFQLCTTGFDRWDELVGMFSAICAVGVAFFPTSPSDHATALQRQIGFAHYTFAALLFASLAGFCLLLFKLTKPGGQMTLQKIQRNRVYTACGWAIIVSMALIAVLAWAKIEYLPGGLGSSFCFESTGLIAFGAAWLVKGELFLKDKPEPLAVKAVQ